MHMKHESIMSYRSSEEATVQKSYTTPLPTQAGISNTNPVNCEKRVLKDVYRKQVKVCAHLHDNIQRELVLLWQSCSDHEESQGSHLKQKEGLELWRHINNCSDKCCKVKLCQLWITLNSLSKQCVALKQSLRGSSYAQAKQDSVKRTETGHDGHRLKSHSIFVETAAQENGILKIDLQEEKSHDGGTHSQICNQFQGLPVAAVPDIQRKKRCLSSIRWHESVKQGEENESTTCRLKNAQRKKCRRS